MTNSFLCSFPATREAQQSIADVFEQKYGFPGVAGAIDGTFIQIRRPNVRLPQDYMSHKYKKYGVTMHAVVDANLNYLDVRACAVSVSRSAE